MLETGVVILVSGIIITIFVSADNDTPLPLLSYSLATIGIWWTLTFSLEGTVTDVCIEGDTYTVIYIDGIMRAHKCIGTLEGISQNTDIDINDVITFKPLKDEIIRSVQSNRE